MSDASCVPFCLYISIDPRRAPSSLCATRLPLSLSPSHPQSLLLIAPMSLSLSLALNGSLIYGVARLTCSLRISSVRFYSRDKIKDDKGGRTRFNLTRIYA